MSSGKKNKKLNSGEGFTLGGDESLSLSLGSILGKEGAERKEHISKKFWSKTTERAVFQAFQGSRSKGRLQAGRERPSLL